MSSSQTSKKMARQKSWKKKTSVKSIHIKLNSSQVSYTEEVRHKLVTSNHHEKSKEDTTQTTIKNTAYDKSKNNNPQVIFLPGSKQTTTKAT